MLCILGFYQFFQQRRVDYEQLKKLLAAENWAAADHETTVLLQDITLNRQGFLEKFSDVLLLDIFREPIQIDIIPCQDLILINRLWSQYSNKRFGFSAQQAIWKTLDPSIVENLSSMELKYAQAFDDKVQWTSEDATAFYGKIENLPLSQLPQGYLPHQLYYDIYSKKTANGQGYINQPLKILSILSTVESCRLENLP